MAALLVGASVVLAAATPEQKCQKGSYAAAAKYNQCRQKALANYFGSGVLVEMDHWRRFQAAAGKCSIKYAATWTKLNAKWYEEPTTCNFERYQDSVDGTVTDRLTGLQWEKKTSRDDLPNPADPHDADNVYSWSATTWGTAADGTAFTTFLPALNSGGCFVGQCDWRLPTIYELQTILLEPYLCTTNPCIDQAVFGPMMADRSYWSATTLATDSYFAWTVYFGDGRVDYDVLRFIYINNVRAVRAGL